VLPTILILIPLFLLGTAVGSFLNVVSRRLLRGDPDVVSGRSRCESCGKTLSGIDLIPLLSFFLLRGRCHYCGEKLSWQYPLVEGGTGLLFAALGWQTFSELGFNLSSLITCLLLLIAAASLIVIFTTDLLEKRVFDQVVLIGIVSAFFYRLSLIPDHSLLVTHYSSLIYDLLLATAVFAFFWFLRLVTKGRGMGEGDPPLGFLTALLVGFPLGLVMLVLAFVLGAAVGLALLLSGRKKFGEQIPFGPFLVVATFVSIFLGESILNWYLGILGI